MHRISVKQRGLNRPHCHRHSCLAPLGRPTVHRLAPEPPDFRKQLPDAHPRRVERPLRALVQCSLLLHRLTQVLCFRPPLLKVLKVAADVRRYAACSACSLHPAYCSPTLLQVTPHRRRGRGRGRGRRRRCCSSSLRRRSSGPSLSYARPVR